MSVAGRAALENRLRSMPITGVMPEPAVTNSSCSGIGIGSTKSPAACWRWIIWPARTRCTRCWETIPSGIALTVMLMCPSGRGPWVSE